MTFLHSLTFLHFLPIPKQMKNKMKNKIKNKMKNKNKMKKNQ